MLTSEAGQTVLVQGIGVCIVERRYPSGCTLVRDCLGELWLVARDGPPAEKVPHSLFSGLRRKEVSRAKSVGPARQGR